MVSIKAFAFPSAIREFVPAEDVDVSGPGTANSSRSSSMALFAVRIDPDRIPASMTTVVGVRAAINLLRCSNTAL